MEHNEALIALEKALHEIREQWSTLVGGYSIMIGQQQQWYSQQPAHRYTESRRNLEGLEKSIEKKCDSMSETLKRAMEALNAIKRQQPSSTV